MSEINNNNNFAIPFITFNSSIQKFIISPESKKIFCNSSYSKIGIISLIGKYRTGKSFLLNKVFLKKKGFNVGSSIKACTKGIWLWSNPLLISNSFCEEFPVFLIDTEGLCAYDEEINHDSKIFLISVLISSLLIYNSFGTIDEQALNNLSLIVNLSKNLNKSKYFPSFLWILRDFALKLEDNEGNLITAKEYLENALNAKNEEKNYVRNVIKNYFKERDCFTIVRPVENESDLQRLNYLEDEKIRPEFLEQIEILRNKIFMIVKPKNFEGKNFSGENFFFFVENVVECVNNGNVPNIENCWNYVINIEMNKKIDENVKNYRKKLNDFKEENFNKNEYFFELEKFNLNLNDEIIKNFNEIIKNFNEKNEFLNKLKKNLNKEFKNFNDENKFLNKEKISNEIELKLNEIFNEKILNENYLIFFNDLMKIKDEFYLKIKNFDLNEIFIEKIIFYIKKFVEEILKKNNEKIEILNNENQTLKLKINFYEEKIKNLNKEFEYKNENFNLNIEKLKNEIKSKEKEILLNNLNFEKISSLEKQKINFLENEFKKFNNEKNLLFNVFNNTNEIKEMIKNLNKNNNNFNYENDFNNFTISDSNLNNFNNLNKENFNNLNNNFNNNFIKISIIGKNIKKDEKNKLFLEYLIEVKTEKKNYKISKKFLQFSLLNKTLKNLFKNLINLPETGSLFLNVNEMNENSFHNNKINQLNFYVNELCKIDAVVNSEPFKNFFELENEHKNINENVLVENKKIIIEKQQKNFYGSNKKNF